MKTLLTSVFLFYSILCFSQTTEEEYNYIVKGYQVQVIEQGGDIKKGYSIKDLGEWKLHFSNGYRSVVFKGFYRTNAAKPCAIMAIYQIYSKEGKVISSEYYCIPSENADSSLWDETIEQLNSHYNESKGREVYEAMLSAFMHFATMLADR
jgi:hypothetical protein